MNLPRDFVGKLEANQPQHQPKQQTTRATSMNTPNPLVPQGLLPQSKGKSTVRIAVFSIIAIHAVFFAGLLMQGCKRDETGKSSAEKSNDAANVSNELAKLDTNYSQSLPDTTAAATNISRGATPNAAGLQPGATPSALTAPSQPAAEALSPAIPTETKEYTIAKGDTLAKIAKTHHVTLGELSKANPGLDPRKLKAGQKIQVPVASQTSSNELAGKPGIGFTEPSKPNHNGSTSGSVHVVKAGETLTKLAKQHGVSVKALRTANGLKTDRLTVGQKIKIPASAGMAGTNEPSGSSLNSTISAATNPAANATVR